MRPAAIAYRADFSAGQVTVGDVAAAWLSVASVLEHAALLGGEERAKLIVRAKRLAERFLAAGAVKRFVADEWYGVGDPDLAAVVVLSEEMIQGGALHLAGTTIDALLSADESMSELDRARLAARRARVDWMNGKTGEADAIYRRLEALGRSAKSPEIAARALVGFVALAQQKGNYPEMDRQARRAFRVATRAGLPRLARHARNGLMIAASARRRFDDAVLHGWAVYQASAGSRIDEGEALQNLAQVLALAGQTVAARAAFALIATRELPARIMLPALGGLALTSAATGERAVARWAVRQVHRCLRTSAPRYALASALIECTEAMLQLGESAEAERLRQAALGLGKAHDFYEIWYKADSLHGDPRLATPREPVPLARRAAGIALELTEMEPARLPRHIGLGAGAV